MAEDSGRITERFLVDMNDMREDFTIRRTTRITQHRIPRPGTRVILVDTGASDTGTWHAIVIAVEQDTFVAKVIGPDRRGKRRVLEHAGALGQMLDGFDPVRWQREIRGWTPEEIAEAEEEDA